MQDTIELPTETLIDRHPTLALELLAASSRLGPDGIWAPDYVPVALRKWVQK